jgi:hypothetical protein
VWWCTPVIPATREVKVGKLQIQASLNKVSRRPYLKSKLKIKGIWALVAHPCNPSYSEGRYQEDHNLRPARENSLQDPTLKISNIKKGWWSVSSDKVPA